MNPLRWSQIVTTSYQNPRSMIAALISATVALLIFAWTQWMTGLRARHELLRSKLEELCRTVVNLRGKIVKATQTHLPEKLDEQRDVLTQIDQGITDDILTVQMLSSLYFPMLRERVLQVAHAAESSIGRREWFGNGGGGRPTSFDILVNSKAFQALAANTLELIEYVNLEYAVLTETPWTKCSAVCSRVLS